MPTTLEIEAQADATSVPALGVQPDAPRSARPPGLAGQPQVVQASLGGGSSKAVAPQNQGAQAPAPIEASEAKGAKPLETIAARPHESADAREAERATRVLQQFRMQLHPGMRSVSMQLSPAELGRLSIRIRVDGDQVQAVVRAETEEALAVLQEHVQELESALADQGFENPSFEFFLDQQSSDDSPAWHSSNDASSQLEELIDQSLSSEDRLRVNSQAIGVDTYA